jgi:hypothetical protein
MNPQDQLILVNLIAQLLRIKPVALAKLIEAEQQTPSARYN